MVVPASLLFIYSFFLFLYTTPCQIIYQAQIFVSGVLLHRVRLKSVHDESSKTLVQRVDKYYIVVLVQGCDVLDTHPFLWEEATPTEHYLLVCDTALLEMQLWESS